MGDKINNMLKVVLCLAICASAYAVPLNRDQIVPEFVETDPCADQCEDHCSACDSHCTDPTSDDCYQCINIHGCQDCFDCKISQNPGSAAWPNTDGPYQAQGEPCADQCEDHCNACQPACDNDPTSADCTDCVD